MSIIGIDRDKCSNCKQCIQECGRGYFSVNEAGEVIFNDNSIGCNICGHCIAICPEEAIETKNLDDVENYSEIDSPGNFVESDKLLKFLRAKRSIRRYKNKMIPKELLEKVFEAMRYAPSATNARAWRYLIVSDPEKIKELNEEIVKVSYEYLGFQSGEQALEYLKSTGKSLFYEAPYLIVLYYRTVEKNTVMIGLRANDAGIALTYGMLEAESLGLGTCWIGMVQGAVARNKEILKILGIKGMVLGAFILGYPAVKYRRAVPRPPLKIKGLD
jgi:nitroreductase/NAD-dependent dihydropyrimidine dehydrogenase PreA subunit